MVIRKAGVRDLDSLAQLFNSYRLFYKQQDDIQGAKDFLKKRIQNNQSVIFLAEEENTIVGFTQLYPLFSSVSMQESYVLNDLFVLEDFRGKGYGELLLTKAKEFCNSKKAKGLTLETDYDNPAQKLYERLGWKRDTEVYHYTWISKSNS